MAVEAGRQLQRALPAAAAVELTLASTTLPFAERLNAGIVAAALGLAPDAVLRDVGLERARRAHASWRPRCAVRHGDGAQLRARGRASHRPAGQRAGDDLRRRRRRRAGRHAARRSPPCVASRSTHADLVDHFRESGQHHDYGWEERWVRDEGYMKIAAGTIRDCLADAGVAAADVAHFAMPAPLARVNDAVAKRVGIAAGALVSAEHETVGDLGSAQPLAMLDIALRAAAPGALILVAAFGSGCDALLLRRTARPCPGAVPDAGRSRDELHEVPVVHRPDRPRMGHARRDGQQDRAHRRLARPCARRALRRRPLQRAAAPCSSRARSVCVNPECRAQDTQEPVSLADVPARVLSHTSDYLAYTPNPPFQFGHIDFEGGGRVLMEFADTDPDELRVGLPLRMVYRIKDFDRNRGFRRYFWKATPVRDAADARDDGGALNGQRHPRQGRHPRHGLLALRRALGLRRRRADARGLRRGAWPTPASAPEQIEAAWLGVCLEENNVGKTAGPLAQALRLPRIAATRVENACATGTEALRGAAYAVAAGAYDIVLALGVEKLKDTGYGGLPVRTRGVGNDLWLPNATAPGAFAQLASAYAAKHGVAMADLKRAMAHVSVKSHANARAQPEGAPAQPDHRRGRAEGHDDRGAARPVRLLRRQRRRGLRDPDDAGDRARAAARRRGRHDQGARGVGQQRRGSGLQRAGTARTSPRRARPARAPTPAPASPTRAAQIQMAEVHDCFSITEAVLMEDLGFSAPGRAIHDVLDGVFDRDGALPVQPDGGLKCFGHPIGASGPAHGLRDLPAAPRPRRRAAARSGSTAA